MQNFPEVPEKKPEKSKQQKAGMLLVEAGTEFAVMIGLPLIGFIFLGKWLDTKYQHRFFVVIGIFLAIALSSYMIYKKIQQIKDLLK
ncbi:MAG: AtpZ/AtpI family protein [Candidatus Doudnabacteria bacterium]|nr:AtpZ/AtpI family protein [Candidatus Doudnabacteria bacterium]